MGDLRARLRHAFAVDPPGPAEPAPEQREAVDRFCRKVASKRMTTPGLIALEMAKPLNFLAAQVMHFFSPGVWALARPKTHEEYGRFAEFLEKRGSTEYIAQRIEHFEKLLDAQRAEARAAKTAAGTGSGDADGGAAGSEHAGEATDTERREQ